ncbi:DUF2079 domain-containing protein [Actinoplanes sp. NPDC049596]|uniref:DUF2079 domain-containing protein n=1 Tax=unclassified Actinoplanes TaxID=2626549 RepID=UPI00342496A6
MSVAAPTTPSAADRPAVPGARVATRRLRADLLVALVALGLAVYVTAGLWSDPYRHAVADNVGDQAFFEWVLAYGVHLVQHGGDPFFTGLLNAPDGVNLAANTSITIYAILFTPLTMLAGPQISFVTILTLNLAGSAFVWYLFLGRWVTRNRLAAAVGGLFAGFAPGFISHANGHLNWTSGWIAPLVLWQLLRMRDQRHWIRNGLILGVMLAVGFSIAAEGLFFTALAGAVFAIVWALARPNRGEAREVLPKFLGSLGLTAVVAGALLAYPLYMHFAGPQTFKGTGFNQRHYSEDLASFFAFADRSIGAKLGLGNDLAPNPTEETSFFGLPLMLLVVATLVVLWRRADEARRATLRALIVVGLVFFVVALGPRLRWFDTEQPIPLPYALLQKLPLFDAALPLRFALVLVGVIAVVLALFTDRLLASRHKPVLVAALALALVPIFPIPLLYRERAAEPEFISSGAWKDYTTDGGVITTLPFAINVAADGQRWQAYTMARGGAEFRIPDGYFLGPDVQGAEGKGRIGALPRATDWLFLRAALYGYIADLDNWDRASARADFQRWGVTAVYLPDGEITGPEGPLFRQAVEITATDLLGRPEHVKDALVWRIRPGVDPIDR